MSGKHGNPMIPSSKTVIFPLVFIAVVIILITAVFLGIAGINPLSWFGGSYQKYSYNQLLMSTEVQLVFYSREGRRAADDIAQKTFEEMERFEAMFNRGLEGSEVWKINENAGVKPVKVNSHTLDLIEESLYFAVLSEGRFDITIAPLVDGWGFFPGVSEAAVPAVEKVTAARSLVDYSLLQVNPEAGEVFLPEKGMALDLGGIAKGYIVDRGMDILVGEGIEQAFLNAGGDIRVLGGKEDSEPWNIGITNPRKTGGDGTGGHPHNLLATIPLETSAIVTSGDYQRYFEEDGIRYHHILDPFTGFPAGTLASVTIVAPEAKVADALSTAVFVLGPRGLELIEQLPEVEAFIVTSEMEIIYSSGLDGIVNIHNK